MRRDTGEKKSVKIEMLEEYIGELLNEIQENMLSQARNFVQKNTNSAETVKELYEIMEHKKGFVKAMWCGSKRM